MRYVQGIQPNLPAHTMFKDIYSLKRPRYVLGQNYITQTPHPLKFYFMGVCVIQF